MKKLRMIATSHLGSFFLYTSLVLSFDAHSQQPTLNILNWADYLSEQTINEWEKLNDSKIRLITYDNEDMRDLLLTDTKQHQIDLAIVDVQSANKLANLGYLFDLNVAQFKGNIEPKWLETCGDHAVPYLWGTLGIAYRTDKVTSPVDSWADLFSSRQDLKGHIAMLGDYYGLSAPALIHLNLSPYTDKEQDLKKMYELLKQQSDDVLTYDYAPSYLLDAENKDDMYAAVVYSGDQYTMNDSIGKDVWKYVLPKESSFLWLDCWVIPANSEKKVLAQSFIDYIGRADVAAANSESIGVATVDLRAYQLQSSEMREDELIYPSQEVLDGLYSFQMLSDANIRKRIRIQEAIKVIHESK